VADPRPGALLVVATPIGNLEDVTLRALAALRACDVVLAEDTRRTRSLLHAHGIERPLERLDDHVVRTRGAEMLDRMSAGQTFALVSDAGTPMVSDPGAALVRAAVERGVRVEALPGPSAALAALCVSGLAGAGFRFVGFLPRDGSERRAALMAAARDPLPTVLYESPERTADTLAALRTVCGDERRVALCRELTKLHETVVRDSLGGIVDALAAGTVVVRGEVSLVLEGAPPIAQGAGDELPPQAALDAALDAALAAGLRPSDASREVARALGLRRADVYARLLERTPR
jgi:16S rRNA (cytidine1402-2'-O)-methyltransferase